MENILKTIEKFNLIQEDEIICVATSGGSDSMALLHYLNNLGKEKGFEVIAVTINHHIRETAEKDVKLVSEFCKENDIRFYQFDINAPKLAKQQKESLETVSRNARIKIFNSLIEKNIADKIAIAHHQKDQAETILINLFRGAGISGAKGMSAKSNHFIRPLLNTSKQAVLNYCLSNDIPWVEDETNLDDAYSRNFVRNQLLPLIETKWPNVVEKLCAFGNDCEEIDNFLSTQIHLDSVIFEENIGKIPTSYFIYHNAKISKIIFTTLKKMGVQKDIERKHIEQIKELALHGENGNRINLPNKLTAIKEYDYLVLQNKEKKIEPLYEPFKIQALKISDFGTITIKKTKTIEQNSLCFDLKKIPKDAVWRYKEKNDQISKFGGGTKKLKDYLIEKKIPQRIRQTIPVLASGNEILIVANVGISEKIKVDEKTTSIYKVVISD